MATKFITVSIEIMHDTNLNQSQKFMLAEIEQLCSLESGCFASNNHFAELIGITKENVSRNLNHLKEMGYIDIKIENGSRNHTRIVTLTNLVIPPYQNSNTPLLKQQETKENIQTNKTNNKTKTHETQFLPSCISSDVWAEWVQHRKEKKNPLTPTTIKKQFKQLEEFNRLGMDTTEVINASIAGGYAGLFALRTGKKYEPPKSKMDVTMETYERVQEMKRQQAGKQDFINGEIV